MIILFLLMLPELVNSDYYHLILRHFLLNHEKLCFINTVLLIVIWITILLKGSWSESQQDDEP